MDSDELTNNAEKRAANNIKQTQLQQQAQAIKQSIAYKQSSNSGVLTDKGKYYYVLDSFLK